MYDSNASAPIRSRGRLTGVPEQAFHEDVSSSRRKTAPIHTSCQSTAAFRCSRGSRCNWPGQDHQRTELDGTLQDRSRLLPKLHITSSSPAQTAPDSSIAVRHRKSGDWYLHQSEVVFSFLNDKFVFPD